MIAITELNITYKKFFGILSIWRDKINGTLSVITLASSIVIIYEAEKSFYLFVHITD